MVDFTRRNVERQLTAMGVDVVEVGVLDPGRSKEDYPMSLRTWSIDQLFKSLGWLKRQNAAGRHIFIRPLGSQGLILIDDLSLAALANIESDRIFPACVVESSPMNYQAWVRVSNEPVDEGLATALAVTLAKRYGGDPASADWRHFGRLVGFTNRKRKYVREDGSYPYVMLRQSTTKAATYTESASITTLISDATILLIHRQEAESARLEALRVAPQQSVPHTALPDPEQFYRTQLHGLIGRYGATLNLSYADWMIGKKMVQQGYVYKQVKRAIHTASPNLDLRKSGHVDNYLTRTTNKLFGISNDYLKHKTSVD